MRAVVFEEFGGSLEVQEVLDPVPPADGVVIEVAATGLCRSDWHGWMGHDPSIGLPHVPGHEFAGVVTAAGPGVTSWRAGDRVTVPFVCACGRCTACAAGDQQVCERQTQPGFTHWGSFADYVMVRDAEINLVRLPDDLPYPDAAALGCRFATAFRAVVARGRVAAGEWVAVHGCGGVGLSAVMIAAACGARVVAVDIAAAALEQARRCGAAVCIDPAALTAPGTLPQAVRDATGGGAHLSIDAAGSPATCAASVQSLRRKGRHVQIGLLAAAAGRAELPMDLVIAYELELLGSHGMAAHAYPELLTLVAAGVLRPGTLVTQTITLADAPDALASMTDPPVAGIRLIQPGRSGGR